MRKKTLAVLALGLGLVLTGCAGPGPADEYTGPATIQDTYKSGKKSGCKLVVTLPSGQTDTISVGRRSSCNGYSKGQGIQLHDGDLAK